MDELCFASRPWVATASTDGGSWFLFKRFRTSREASALAQWWSEKGYASTLWYAPGRITDTTAQVVQEWPAK